MKQLRMWHLVGAAALALLMSAGLGTARADLESGSSSPTMAAIDAARDQGVITPEQAIVYKLYSIRNSALLPHTFALSGEPSKCATPVVLEAMEMMEGLPPDTRLAVQNLMARPTLDSYVDTAHFRIHYSTSGANMIYLWPNTNYRDSVMVSAEKAWNQYHVLKGWQIPPSDGAMGGGSGLIDLYVDDLGTGYYGVTYAESPAPAWPHDYTAYLIIDNDYTGFGYADRADPMKVTVAHEYHHVVQMGYTTQNGWWMENMATFEEDQVYDSIDDNHQYLGCYMSKPYKKLILADGCHEYACFIWPTMLSERWVDSLIRDAELCTATTGIYTCFNTVLATVGSTFGEALAEWGQWNYYTGIRNDGNHYEEAGLYTQYMAADRSFNVYPTGDQHPSATKMPEEMSTSVQLFRRETGSTDNKLRITYNGNACTKQVVVIAKEPTVAVFHEYYMTLDANGDGSVDVLNWDTMENAYMLVAMPQECGIGTYDYVFSADTYPPTAVEDPRPALYTRTVRLDQNSPNPFGLDTRIGYHLESGGAVRLTVFDAGGRQTRTLIQAAQPAGDYSVRWDAQDDLGHPVAPGVYFYRLEAGGAPQVRKMIVVE